MTFRSNETTYKGFLIDHVYTTDNCGKKIKGSDEYVIYDEDFNPLSVYFKTLKEAKQYINLFA